jgi:hypothetical protein
MSMSASATGVHRTSKVIPMASTVDGSELEELDPGVVGVLVSAPPRVHDPIARRTTSATMRRAFNPRSRLRV